MPFEVAEKIFERNRALLQVRFYRRWFSESVALFVCEIVGRTWSPRAKYSIGRVRNSRVLSDMDQPGPGRDSLARTWHEPCTERWWFAGIWHVKHRILSLCAPVPVPARRITIFMSHELPRLHRPPLMFLAIRRYRLQTDIVDRSHTKRRYLPTNLRCTRRVVISWKFQDREICPIRRYATAT